MSPAREKKPNEDARNLTRRQFLTSAGQTAAALAVGAGLPSIIPASARGANAPSNRINIAMIGTGNQGTNDLKAFLQQDDARIVAVCDVNRAGTYIGNTEMYCGREPARKIIEDFYGAQQRSGRYRGCDAYADFREVLARPDVDAVAIVVPDHWHAVMAILAARAGKDIYCEKPLALTVEDGRAIVEAVRRAGIVFQTGSHERSNARMRFMCELVRNGRIGKLKRIQAVVGPWNKTAPTGAWQPTPPPEGFDYEMWLGPAPYAPYHPDRCFYNFRFIHDYSNGQVTNFGAHSLDIAQWGNGTDHTGPVEFEDLGSEWPADGLFDVAKTVHFRARYANGVELECITRDEKVSTRFEGDEGWVESGYHGFFTSSESLKTAVIGPDEIHLGTSINHMRNFLDAIKTRGETIAPVEIGHRSATICQVGNIAMKLKRKLQWNPETERFTGDDEANQMLGRPKRGIWTL